MATLSDIRSLVRDFISQENTSNTDFTDAELNGYINQGVRFLGALVKQPRRMDTIQAVAGQSEYSLQSDAVIIRTAYFGNVSTAGDVIPLVTTTEEALKERFPGWLSQATSERGRPSHIILKDRSTVLVYPTPTAEESATGKIIRVGIVYQPAALSSDSSSPDIPIVYHDFVADYAYYLCAVGKLNLFEKGVVVLNTMIDKAKKFENLIVKDIESGFGFSWGGSLNPNDEGNYSVNP